MTNEQKRSIIKLLREYVKLEADNFALKAILISEQKNRRPTSDWETDLRCLQDSPDYKRTIEANEPLIARIEKAMNENDLIELLAQNPPKGPPN